MLSQVFWEGNDLKNHAIFRTKSIQYAKNLPKYANFA